MTSVRPHPDRGNDRSYVRHDNRPGVVYRGELELWSDDWDGYRASGSVLRLSGGFTHQFPIFGWPNILLKKIYIFFIKKFYRKFIEIFRKFPAEFLTPHLLSPVLYPPPVLFTHTQSPKPWIYSELKFIFSNIYIVKLCIFPTTFIFLLLHTACSLLWLYYLNEYCELDYCIICREWVLDTAVLKLLVH